MPFCQVLKFLLCGKKKTESSRAISIRVLLPKCRRKQKMSATAQTCRRSLLPLGGCTSLAELQHAWPCMQLTREKGGPRQKKRSFKKVQKFSGYILSFQGIKCKNFCQKKATKCKNNNNATYKGKSPFRKKC